MLTWFKAFFSDEGTQSMTRLLSFLCVAAALLISLIAIYNGSSPDSVVGLVSVFLAAGFGGKIAQKFAEVKEAPEVSNEEK